MRYVELLAIAVLVFGPTACFSEINAALTIDGQAFVPTTCSSGEHDDFIGVDLMDDSDRVLRLAQSPTNQTIAIWLADTETIEIGPCGTMSIQRQGSRVDDITNIEGSATLECKANEHAIAGTVSFKNCH